MKPTILIFLLFLLQSCSQQSAGSDTTLPRIENYLKTGDSHIYYETYGKPENEALLLIHGSGADLHSMGAQVEYFREEFFVIAADNRTHGKSGPAEELTYEVMMEDYILILHDLGIERTNVMGYSDGGIIALLLAMENPDHIGKVISISPNLRTNPETIAVWDLEMSSEYMAYIESMLEQGDTSQNWMKEKQHINLLLNEPNIASEELSKIQSPVLVIAADDDIILPEHILEIYRSIPQSQLSILPGTTHLLLRDNSKMLNQMAARFLKEPFIRPTSKEEILKLINGES